MSYPNGPHAIQSLPNRKLVLDGVKERDRATAEGSGRLDMTRTQPGL
jgi:hypothetical protein